MALPKEPTTSSLEWRIKMENGNSQVLVPMEGFANRAWHGAERKLQELGLKVSRFFKKAWDLGVDDPRKVVHCLKVGVALTVVSLFYYMRPLYEGVGGNAMWAVMTVVVVFEQTAGATLSKSLNRICGTVLAGSIGVGVNWLADKSGETYEPAILGTSVFLLASAATFSRFIPSVKARFDYGAMIFILTFSLVSVSGYRVDELFALAHQRISTIIVGTFLCILISMLICPIWAGQELHNLIIRNMNKLADSLEGCVAYHFDGEECSKNEDPKKITGYHVVLTSKATEESMANFARWEPAHGRFGFCHSWKQYLKIGASLRKCAYSMEAVHSCTTAETKAPEMMRNHLSDICLTVSVKSSTVLRDLAITIKAMKKSSGIDVLLKEMDVAVQDLQNRLAVTPLHFSSSPPEATAMTNKEKKTLPDIPLMDIVPTLTLASLLMETSGRIKETADAVKQLAELSKFKPEVPETLKHNKPANTANPHKVNDEENLKVLQRV